MTPDQREAWEERAGIMEYMGGMARDAAEIEAARTLGLSRELLRMRANEIAKKAPAKKV